MFFKQNFSVSFQSIAKIIEDALANTNEYIVNSVWNFLNSRFESIGEGLLMERTVAELLYNGWDISPYLKIIQDLCSQQFISTLCNSLGAGDILEELGKNPYFGLFSRVCNFLCFQCHQIRKKKLEKSLKESLEALDAFFMLFPNLIVASRANYILSP